MPRHISAIVTKSDMVADEEYIAVLDKGLAHIQITVTMLDDNLYKRLQYEKASLPTSARKEKRTREQITFQRTECVRR